ncbi:MAG: DUF45 domain-containing protein [Candidatus Omnitrophica bacterium]|nr:DUF45 domain-containing protein [Candidatus Omnitrophota bacterium]MBU4457352.1 DUF45 domain-containing protein [Candidatus Omnitrophota bacterium]
MDVKINYSNRRSRTVSAQLINGDLIVNAPAAMPCERLEKIIENFKVRFERRKLKEELNKEQPLTEMTHLIEPNHNAAFWNIVSRYELAERAKGYLMALGLDSDNEQDLENSQR